MEKSNLLQGKVAFITGGAQGIGKAVAKSFIKHGGKAILADCDQKKLEKTKTLSAENFPQEILAHDGHTAEVVLDAKLPLAEVRRQSLEQVERQYLKELLTIHQGRVNRAAETAGITTRQLHKLLTKYLIRKETFKPSKKSKQQISKETL